MKNLLMTSIALIGLFFSQLKADIENAPSCSRWYIGGLIGASHIDSDLEIDTHLGLSIGLSIGYQLSTSFRLEGELSSSINQFKELDFYLNTDRIMANLLYVINSKTIVRPYFGFGAGTQYRSITFDDHYTFSRGKTFTYQGISGLMIPFTDVAFACLEYRYIKNTIDSDNSQSVGLNIKRHF